MFLDRKELSVESKYSSLMKTNAFEDLNFIYHQWNGCNKLNAI